MPIIIYNVKLDEINLHKAKIIIIFIMLKYAFHRLFNEFDHQMLKKDAFHRI